MSEQLRSRTEESIRIGSSQVFHSAERHRLDLALAGPSSRILAYAIDYCVIVLIQLVVITLVIVLTPLADSLQSSLAEFGEAAANDDPELERWAVVMLGFFVVTQLLVEWVYFVFLEMTTRGRSLGKAIVKLRVVGDGGHPLSLGQSIARNLLRAVDILPGYYAVGLVSMVALDEGKRLGDLAAGTCVIRLDRPTSQPMLSSPPTAGTEIFRFDHPQIARLGRAEKRLVRQTLRRLPELRADQAVLALERTVGAIIDRIDHDPVPVEHHEEFLQALLQAAERR